MNKVRLIQTVTQGCTISKYWTGVEGELSFSDWHCYHGTFSTPSFAVLVSVNTVGNRTVVLGSKWHCSALSDDNFEIGIHAFSQEFLKARFFSGHRPRPANWINCYLHLY